MISQGNIQQFWCIRIEEKLMIGRNGKDFKEIESARMLM
jgi:hypothetical protein